MSNDRAAKRAAFRKLHQEGHFVIPNPWDIGSMRRLEQLGFKALASTSAGYAWSLGREDGELSRDEVLDHLRMLCAATELPVNADFEAGFADQPDEVAANVLLAIETGVAGLSIEDRTGHELYPTALAVARMQAARNAIDTSGQDVLLVGRTEGLLIGKSSLEQAIERLVVYSGAGADVLYAPGVTEPADIRAIVAAVGAAFAAAAWAGFDAAARSVRDHGHLPAARQT